MSEYDLVVRGGTVIDGSGGEPFVGDVAISDGKIAAIGAFAGTGADEIDAAGRIVTPGFKSFVSAADSSAAACPRTDPSAASCTVICRPSTVSAASWHEG